MLYDLIREDPILLLFLVLGLGYMIGRIRLGPFRLGEVAGVLLATSSGLDLSLSVFVLAAFPAVLLGGLDSIPGTLVGGLIIGLSVGLASASKAPIVRNAAEIMPYVVLLIVLLIRPEGIFGQKRIERI